MDWDVIYSSEASKLCATSYRHGVSKPSACATWFCRGATALGACQGETLQSSLLFHDQTIVVSLQHWPLQQVTAAVATTAINPTAEIIDPPSLPYQTIGHGICFLVVKCIPADRLVD